MTPEKEQALQEHLDAIADRLYEDTKITDVNDLEKIETVVREKI